MLPESERDRLLNRDGVKKINTQTSNTDLPSTAKIMGTAPHTKAHSKRNISMKAKETLERTSNN